MNRLFIEKSYLEAWGVETKLPFQKPGKDTKNPSNYRGISLTSCICKLMERMVENRFMWFMEKKYNPAQSSFFMAWSIGRRAANQGFPGSIPVIAGVEMVDHISLNNMIVIKL